MSKDFDVDAVVRVTLDDIAEGDFEQFLDLLEDAALSQTGNKGSILMDIQYEAVGVENGLVLIRVQGDLYGDGDEDSDTEDDDDEPGAAWGFDNGVDPTEGEDAEDDEQDAEHSGDSSGFPNAIVTMSACDECGAMIPDIHPSMVNAHHKDSCSLYGDFD